MMRSALQRLQCLHLRDTETWVPHRAGVLQDWTNHGAVKTQQVVPPGARTFQLLKEVQSRGHLQYDGVNMLQPLQVTRDMHSQQLEHCDAFHGCAAQTDGRRRVLENRSDQQLFRLPAVHDHACEPSWTWRLYGDGIMKVLWAWKLEKLISSGNNFTFDTFRNFEPVKRFENMISRGLPGSSNNGTGERILDMLKSI